MSEKPRRRIEVDIRIGADSWDAVRRALDSIAFDIATQEEGGRDITSGAPDSGYTLTATEDPSITHDSYFEAAMEWIRERAKQ